MFKKIFTKDNIIAFFVIVFIIVLGTSIGLSSLKKQEQVKERKVSQNPIFSLNFKTEQTGSYFSNFFYGYGTLENKEYYVVYVEESDGGLKLTKYPVEKSKIYPQLDENTAPYVEITSNGYGTIVEIKLYIPENSVQSEYKITE
jgi:hypothetical protein